MNYSFENKVYLISVEKNFKEAEKYKRKFKNKIEFKFLKFKKNKLSKLFHIFVYQLIIFKFILFNKINIIHVRSYLPISLVILPKFFKNFKIIFDIRGFWFDEKYEARLIQKYTYNLLKFFEKFFFKNADIIITLSSVSKNIIVNKFNVPSNKIYIIPTFTNFNEFSETNKITKNNNIIFGYIGNLKMNYEFDKVIKFLNFFNKINKNWKLKIASNYSKKDLFLLSNKIFFDKTKIEIKNIRYEDMQHFYKNIDTCIYFLNNKFSKKASCPTKLGELIATNTPFITNPGIGDINKISKKLKFKNFLIKKINYDSVKKINDDLILIKKNKIKYNSRLKLKYFFDINRNIEKYLKITKNL